MNMKAKKFLLAWLAFSVLVAGWASGLLTAMGFSTVGGGEEVILPFPLDAQMVIAGRVVTTDATKNTYLVNGKPIYVGEEVGGLLLAHQTSEAGVFMTPAATKMATIVLTTFGPPELITWPSTDIIAKTPTEEDAIYLRVSGHWDTGADYVGIGIAPPDISDYEALWLQRKLVHEDPVFGPQTEAYSSVIFRGEIGTEYSSMMGENPPDGNIDLDTGEDMIKDMYVGRLGDGYYTYTGKEIYNKDLYEGWMYDEYRSETAEMLLVVHDIEDIDTTPPVIESVTISPTSFEGDDGQIFIRVVASDPQSGISYAEAEWDGPGGHRIMDLTIVSHDGVEKTLEAMLPYSQFSEGSTTIWVHVYNGVENDDVDYETVTKAVTEKFCEYKGITYVDGDSIPMEDCCDGSVMRGSCAEGYILEPQLTCDELGIVCDGECSDDSECPTSFRCIGNKCLQCSTDADCNSECVDNICIDCYTDAHCESGEECSSINNCVPKPADNEKRDLGETCSRGDLCKSGCCKAFTCKAASECVIDESCSRNSECDSGCCRGGDCAEASVCETVILKDLGESCSANGDCKSDYCKGAICSKPDVNGEIVECLSESDVPEDELEEGWIWKPTMAEDDANCIIGFEEYNPAETDPYWWEGVDTETILKFIAITMGMMVFGVGIAIRIGGKKG